MFQPFGFPMGTIPCRFGRKDQMSAFREKPDERQSEKCLKDFMHTAERNLLWCALLEMYNICFIPHDVADQQGSVLVLDAYLYNTFHVSSVPFEDSLQLHCTEGYTLTLFWNVNHLCEEESDCLQVLPFLLYFSFI